MAKKTKSSKKSSKKNVKQETTKNTENEENVRTQGHLANASDFDFSRVAFKEVPFDPNAKDLPSQLNCYPKYQYVGKVSFPDGTEYKFLRDGADLVIYTGEILMSRGGIPKIHPKYRPDDSKREYFWLPCMENDKDATPEQREAVKNLAGILRALDDGTEKAINKKKNKSGMIVTNVNGTVTPVEHLKYTRMLKPSPKQDTSLGGGSTKSKYEPYNRVKVKFATKYDPEKGKDDPKEITTSIFDGVNSTEPLPLTSPTEIEKFFTWKCSARFVLRLAKFWFPVALEDGVRKCGYGVKCDQIVICSRSEPTRSLAAQFSQNVFSSNPAPKKEVEKEEKKTEEKEDKSESESESESSSSESESESEDEDKEEEKEEEKEENNEDEKEDEKSESESESESSSSESESEEEEKPKKGKSKNKKVKGKGKKGGKKKKNSK